jgi:hypothetical protein
MVRLKPHITQRSSNPIHLRGNKKTFHYTPQPTNRTYKQLHSKSKQPIKHQSKTTTNMAFRPERTQRWSRVVVPTNITHSTYRRIITGWSLRTRSPCNTFVHCSIVEQIANLQINLKKMYSDQYHSNITPLCIKLKHKLIDVIKIKSVVQIKFIHNKLFLLATVLLWWGCLFGLIAWRAILSRT